MGTSIQWLGQAGFFLLTSGGKTIAIDPYLSDSCNALVGFKRMVPSPVSLTDFDADYLLISHEHPDHLDIALYEALESKPHIQIFTNRHCKKLVEGSGFSSERMHEISIGDVLDLDGVQIQVLAADHGTLCPDALGFLINDNGHTIYFAGDTAYSPALLQPAITAEPEVALLPINGAYGNLDSLQAAQLAGELRCKTVIPCHFWMFVEHGSCPMDFQNAMQEYPHIQVRFLSLGETMTL